MGVALFLSLRLAIGLIIVILVRSDDGLSVNPIRPECAPNRHYMRAGSTELRVYSDDPFLLGLLSHYVREIETRARKTITLNGCAPTFHGRSLSNVRLLSLFGRVSARRRSEEKKRLKRPRRLTEPRKIT